MEKQPASNPSRKKRTALLIAAVVIALLLGGYTILCAYAGGDGGRMAPNAKIGGVEVGGLSIGEAASILDTALQERLATLEVPFGCGEGQYSVPGTEFSYDAQVLVNSLSPASVPFPARGFQFLASMLNPDGLPVVLSLDHTPSQVTQAAREQGDADTQTTWELRDTAIVFTKGRTGRTVDVAELLPRLAQDATRRVNGEPELEEPLNANIAVAPPIEPDFEAIRQEVYAQVADALGCKGKNDQEKLESLIKAIDGLKEKIGIKPTIRDYVPDEADFLARLDDMVEQAFDDQCTGANPRYPLMSEIRQMYLNAYYGKTFVEAETPTGR